MRAREFLYEYTDLEQEKENIIKTVSGLNASNEEEAKILDRIYKILNSERIDQTMTVAFQSTMSDESFNDKTKKTIIRDMTRILSTLSSDFRRMNSFLDKMEAGGVVNINALSKPLSSFEEVFGGDPVAVEAFLKLARYGSGSNQKGPGEYALALLSNKIALKAGGGDLSIEGMGEVELKAHAGESGGRLGQGGLPHDDAREILSKYNDDVPAILNHFEKGAKGLSLPVFVKYLNNGLPARSPENVKMRQQIALDLYSPVYKEYANGIAKAFSQEDYSVIEAEFVKANFEHYLSQDAFDVLLICGFPQRKFAAVKNADDLIKLRQAGHLKAFSLAAVPTSSGMREAFAQLSLSRAKI